MQDTLKEIARDYWRQGLNIVLMAKNEEGKKLALHNWKKWQTERQTLEDFEALPWYNAKIFAVICGFKGANGLFFTAIDVDYEEFDASLLRITQTEKTPRGGYHFIYWSHKNAKGKKLHTLKVELLGLGNLCIMYPSRDYFKLNDNLPTEIDDIQVVFDDLVKKLGGKPKKPKPKGRVRFCCREALKREVHIGHLMRLAIASEYKAAGYSNEEVVQLFKHQGGFNPDICLVQVESADPNKRAKCETIKEYGYCYPECTETFGVTETFNPVVFAKKLLLDYHFKTTRDNETLYVYDMENKIYKSNGEVLIKEQLADMLDEDTRQKYLADVLFFIKAKTYFDRPQTSLNKIVVENGVLNMLTGVLEENNTTDFLQIKIPVTFDAKAECPIIKQFLKDVVGEKFREFIQEYMGYCLLQKMIYHRSPVFYGEGMNGKTTLLNFLITFLGQENVSSVTLQQLCGNRFAPFQLYGKLANICDDLPDDTIKHTGMFKMLTGNSFIQIEQKFKDSFPHNNTTKLIYATNKIPDANDMTPAWFRRWQPIPCNNKFIGEKRDVNMLEKIITPQELSGFLNYALTGLKKLLDHNDFCIKEDVEKQQKTMIWASNSAKAYIMENLETTKDNQDQITKNELYTKYIKFCEKHNLFKKDAATLTKSIKLLLPNANEITMRHENHNVRGWKYLKFTHAAHTAHTNSILMPEN